MLEQGQKNLFNWRNRIYSAALFEAWDKVTPKACSINGVTCSVGKTVGFAGACSGFIMPANIKSISVRFFNGVDGTQRRYVFDVGSDLTLISKKYYADALVDGITINIPENCVDFWYVQFTAGSGTFVKDGIVVVKGNKIPDKYIPYEE